MSIAQQKRRFWINFYKAMFGKAPYWILTKLFYPFINRSRIRKVWYSDHANWWQKQLWLMLNDDELGKWDEFGEGTDWDVGKDGMPSQWLKKIGLYRLGLFWKSYSFNALRNAGYNYSLHYSPVDPKGSYDIIETIEDSLHEGGEKKSPLWWAIWRFERKDGKLDNKGEKLREDKSIVGKSYVWFHPAGRKDLLYPRKSHAIKYNFLFWTFWETHRVGAFSNKYDAINKWHIEFRDWKFWKGLTPWKLLSIDETTGI